MAAGEHNTDFRDGSMFLGRPMVVDDGMAEQARQFFGNLLHGPGPSPVR